jgi:hypothetical protein
MTAKTFRLKIVKVPLADDIVYKSPRFPAFGELHLDLLENKNKLKKNPPKPIFVHKEHSPEKKSSRKASNKSSNSSTNSSISNSSDRHHTRKHNDDDDDFTLEKLEKAYEKDKHSDEIISNRSTPEPAEKTHSTTAVKEYKPEQFQQEQKVQESEEEKELKEHSDLLYKFMVLRKKYDKIEIPEFTEHSDINTMKRVYNQILRKVSLDSGVENYKKYMFGGLSVLEFVAVHWANIDLVGFTRMQKESNDYDKLLIELGEKNYSAEGSSLPVEVRLLGTIIFNAFVFYLQKTMLGGISLFGEKEQPQQPVQALPRKQKMSGPTTTPAEVEEMARQHRD